MGATQVVTSRVGNVCRIKLTSWFTDTILRTQLADDRSAICQPQGIGRQARSGLGLSWGGTSSRRVGEPVFYPEAGRLVAQFLLQDVSRTPG